MDPTTTPEMLRALAREATALANLLEKASEAAPDLLLARLLLATDKARSALVKHGQPVRKALEQEGTG